MKYTFIHSSLQKFTRLSRQALAPLGLGLLLAAPAPGLAQTQAPAPGPYKWGSIAIGGGGFVSGIVTSKTQAGLMYARTDVGGAYRWDAATKRWIPLMDWGSEDEQGLQGVESLALDPQKPNVLYGTAGISYFNNGRSFFVRSTDYGATFTYVDVTAQFKMHGNGMGRSNGEKLQVDPNNGATLYAGTRSNGVFKTSDTGDTWTRLAALPVTTTPNGNGVSFVLVDKNSAAAGASQRVFVGISRSGSDQNLYKSEDAGATFTPVVNANLAAGMMPQRAVFAGNSLYISYANGCGPSGTATEPYDRGQVWKYDIATDAWTNISPTSINRAFGGLNVDPNNPDRIVISTTNTYLAQGIWPNAVYGDQVLLTTNGGTTWTNVMSRNFRLDPNGITWVPGQSIHWSGCVEFDPFDTKKVWVISGNGVYLNEDIDNSGTWKFTVQGLEETVPQNIVSVPNGPLLTVISDYDGFRHTDAREYAPVHQPRMGSTTGLDFAPLNPGKVVRAGRSMYYSTDAGVTWTKTATINGASGQVALSADGNVILHCPNTGTVTYRSTDNGSTWAPVSGLSFSNIRPIADAVDPAKFYAYHPSNGTLYVSTDGGASFAASLARIGNNGSRVMRRVLGREGHLWLALYGGGLTRSTNSGASFAKVSTVTYCGAVGIGKAAPGAAYETIYIWGTVNGVRGLHRSTDEGASWVRVNDDAHEYGGPANGQFVSGDMNVYGRVYMSTAGRGIVYGEDESTPPQLTAPTDIVVNNTAGTCAASVSLTATASGTPAPVVAYSVEGQPISSTHTFPVGTTTVTATATSFGGKDSKTFTVTVKDNEAPVVAVRNIQVELSAAGQAVITAEQVDNGSHDNCGTLASRVLSKTTFDCGNIGANEVILTVTDTNGNVSTATATVTVIGAVPAPTITVTPENTTYTGGVATNLYLGYGPQQATLEATGGLSYQWSPNAGLSSSTVAAPVFTATAAGTYVYTVAATNQYGCTATATVTMTVVDARCGNGKTLEKVLVCHNGQLLCVAEQAVPALLENSTNPGQLGSCAGLVTAARTTAGDAKAKEGLSGLVFEAYPNPFTQDATVRFRTPHTGKTQLQVYNALGQLVATLYDQMATGGQEREVKLGGKSLPAGIYTCRLTTDGQVHTQRLVLVR